MSAESQPQGSEEPKPQESIILEVDLKVMDNNTEHHTNEFTTEELIVRRGQHFSIRLKLKDPYNPEVHILTFTASTGASPDENRGTKSVFGIPDNVKRSAEAKAIWKAKIGQKESTDVDIIITPPADAPVGKYILSLSDSGEDKKLETLALLFNAWCTDDSVYLENDEERQEYVMNETGVIYTGSGNYIFSLDWDFGQFEDDMMDIVFTLLDKSNDHRKDPTEDEAAWCDPIYVSRVISAMINSQDDRGVLMGNWSGIYLGGKAPTHWSSSHTILSQWLKSDCKPVKYGQCWVFAAVMCSVMRALGIPCRVVTNFQSAHDTNMNLIIDVFHAGYGVSKDDVPISNDSVWNFHVWVEAWMKRPDLSEGDVTEFDGWQVVDPTPQELSDGVYCCGPASVKAILNGHTDLKYDIPFVFAEVNADCVDWLVKADGSKRKIWSDTERVGQNISTKSVGSRKRLNITDSYKHKEGSEKERSVFKYALTRDYSNADEEPETEEIEEDNTVTTEEPAAELPKVSLRFEELSKLVNGVDVKLNLVLHSEATEPRPLSIDISVKAQTYTGSAYTNIQSELKEDTLQSGQDLCIPVVVPFSKYWKPMLDNNVMKVSAVVSDTHDDSETYLAEHDVVLVDPPIEVKMSKEARVGKRVNLDISFTNPVSEALKNCTLTLSGSGLLKDEQEFSVDDVAPNTKMQKKVHLTPYKAGQKTLVVDFDCSVFRDIKKSLDIHVKEKN